MGRRPGHIAVLAKLRADVSSRDFWNHGTTAMLDIRIINLDS